MKKKHPFKSKKQVATNIIRKVAAYFTVTLLLTIPMSTFSQSPKNFKKTIDALKSSVNASEKATGIHMSDLAYELNPSLNIEEGKIAEIKNSETPICLNIDYPSVSILYTNNPKFESIEYLSITVRDFTDIQPLDLSKLTSFKSLKYIHLLIRKECTMDLINKLTKNTNSSVKIYYSIEIPK